MLHIPRSITIGLFVFAVFTSTARSQPTQQDFEWAWSDAISMTLPKGTHASWVEYLYPEMSAEEASALLEKLGDNEADPRWAKAQEAQWLDGEPRRSAFNVWYIDDAHFRVNHDLPQAEWSPDIDAVVNGNEGWIRGANGVLTALDLRNTPRMRDPRSYLDEVQSYVRNILTGGMGRYDSFEIKSYSFEGDNRWSAVVSSQRSGNTYRFNGEYKHDTEQFLVLESRVIESEKYPESIGSSFTYQDYRTSDFLHWYMPARVLQTDSRGRFLREYKARSLDGFDKKNFASYAALPVAGRTDPLRPDAVLRRIDDFRDRTAMRTEIDSTSGDRIMSVLPDDRTFANKSYWNKIGWIAIGIIAIPFILFQIKKGTQK